MKKKMKEKRSWMNKAEMRMAEFLVAGEAYTALFFWPTPGFKENTCDSYGFSADGAIISVSAVLHCERRAFDTSRL